MASNPSMTILDVCAYLGLGAVGMATVNMVLGLLIALRYSPVRRWEALRRYLLRYCTGEFSSARAPARPRLPGTGVERGPHLT